jgi:hypothetical protein
MSGQYVPLPRSQAESVDIQMSVIDPSTKRRYGPPKRKVYIAVALLVMFLLFGLFVRGRFRPRIDEPLLLSDSEPLLGPEDATKLWFPFTENVFTPTVATFNAPPPASERVRTPLLIGFTRQSAMLHQTILSFIAAGWPREDIIVVDNSGTMTANSDNLLSSGNPFHLDYTTLRSHYGVSILQTPTLLNFAQLQNFYLRLALAHGWSFYFWAHMDIAVLSNESAEPYASFYARIQSILTTDLAIHSLFSPSKSSENWALKYFTYDWLTLINVAAWRTIGAWDPFIPYYASDCDAYSRVALHGFTKGDVRAGRIFDLAGTIPHPEKKFFPVSIGNTEDNQPGSSRYRALVAELEKLESRKKEADRNHWQDATGNVGRGQPWTYDPRGFQKMWWDTAATGRDLYRKKWGTSECRLDEVGVALDDEWKVGI